MLRLLLPAVVALTLGACATVQKLDAAADVHALLISIRDDDRAAFENLVDRRALKREIQGRLMAEAAKDRRVPTGLAAILAPSLADLAGETLIQPRVFLAVAQSYGYSPEMKIPGVIGLSTVLRPLPDGRVCATKAKDGPCVLMFTQSTDGRWRLSGFDGDLSMLRTRG